MMTIERMLDHLAEAACRLFSERHLDVALAIIIGVCFAAMIFLGASQ